MASNLARRTTTGAFVSGDARLKSVVLTAGSDVATLTIDDSTDGAGADLLALKAAANTSVAWTAADPQGVLFATAIHGTLAGTGPSATIEYE